MNHATKTRKPGNTTFLEEQRYDGQDEAQVMPVKEVSKIPNSNINSRLKLLLKSLRAMKNGDFSVRLPIEKDGVMSEISEVFNDVVSLNERLANEIIRTSKVIGEEGKLTERVSLLDITGDWQVSANSMNSMINNLAQPTIEVARVITAVAKGDLSEKMTLELEGRPIKGEFLRIGNTVNDMVDQLSAFASEVTRVAREVGTEGQLGGQAEVKGVGGTWKDLTDNVNAMAGNLTSQVRNIAERQHAEEALQESRTNFYNIVERSADGIVVVNQKGVALFVNKTLESILHRRTEELLGEMFGLPVISGDTTEIDIVRKSGEPGTGEISVVETEWEGEPAHLVSLHDITERKKSEEAVKSSELRYRRLFEAARDGILILSKESGEIEDVNPYLIEILGYSREDFLGKQLWEIGAFKDIAPAKVAFTTLRSENYIRYEDLPLQAKDGRLVDVEFVSNVYDVDHKKVIQCNIRNITERKKAHLVRERLTRQLQAQVSELEAFSYGIAHDLRSPLVSIEGFSRLLREDLESQKVENVQEDIRLLESAVRKMQGFLNSTLEYSRSGQMIKRTRNVSFGEIVTEVITEFNGQISSIGATVSLADKFPTVCVDRTRIKQVLTNLIQNSIKYRDKSVPLKIEIGHYPSEGETIFFVSDNGTGIDASEVSKLFELFYRGTADGEGSGIGLAVVKKIIEAHGGRIWIQQGQSGKGTTMCFTLPEQNGTNEGDNNGKD